MIKRPLIKFLSLIVAGIMLGACGTGVAEPETDKPTDSETVKPVDETEESDTETEKPEPKSPFEFDGSVSEETLRAYLSRAVTISTTLSNDKSHIKKFILDVGAKYIGRAATCWSPSSSDYGTYNGQKQFIASVHRSDPDVVFEACLFECVNKDGVGSIPIPSWVFEAFDRPVEERNFNYDLMVFEDGTFANQWGQNSSVPDITRLETRMFFYYRACKYIDIGYEALHMGQVYLMSRRDKGYTCYTELNDMIREYAHKNARRHFVFMNAHVHGIIDANGYLMFDFHMWPSRLYSDPKEDDGDMPASVKVGYNDSIYNDSMGGKTYSGWECEHLPYLVELDNYGDSKPGTRTNDSIHIWGYDEISWFANQSDEYRAEFIGKIIEEVRSADPEGYFAMPGERVAHIYNDKGEIVSWTYFAYDKSNYAKGFGDQAAIKAAFEARDIGD